MPKAVSEELREKVIEYIELGNNYSAAARKFQVSCASVKRWYDRYKKTGSYNIIARKGKKPILSEEEFVSYVKLHPHQTLARIAKHFDVNQKTIHRYMKRYNFFCRKKKPFIWEQREKKKI